MVRPKEKPKNIGTVVVRCPQCLQEKERALYPGTPPRFCSPLCRSVFHNKASRHRRKVPTL
jgi:hypothetical protein